MHFELYEELRPIKYKEPGFIETPDISKGTRLFNLFMQLDERHSDALSAWLNRINNQGILEINCRSWYYIREGYEKLPLAFLSTGEIMFTAAFASKALQIPVYMYHGVRQLTINSLRTMFTENVDNDMLTILCRSEAQRSVFRDILEGKIC